MLDGQAKMRAVGIVGAGEIGSGVAHQFAQLFPEVVLVDISEDALGAARERIRQSARMQRMLRAAPSTDVLERVSFTTKAELLRNVEFIVENVTEDVNIKRDVYSKLDTICAPNVIFAANTSAIPIVTIASYTTRPSSVIGLHFMNPVTLSRAVEVITGPATSKFTRDTAIQIIRALGKEAIVVSDCAGFVSNRSLMLMINEAIATVADGVAPPSEVDRVFRECFGHPMGPLETADLIGLDTVLRTLRVLSYHYGGLKFSPSKLLISMVGQGCCGRKNAKGFYEYSDTTAVRGHPC